MKHIILIKDMNCDHCVEKISEALAAADIAFEMNLNSKSVSILERGDAVVAAERIITDLGYTIL